MTVTLFAFLNKFCEGPVRGPVRWVDGTVLGFDLLAEPTISCTARVFNSLRDHAHRNILA